MDKPFYYSDRQFLNGHLNPSDASVLAYFKFYGESGTGQTAGFKIRDCNHVVELDIGVYDSDCDEGFENSIKKLEIISKSALDFKEFLIKARLEYVQRKQDVEEKEKQGKKEKINLRQSVKEKQEGK